MVDWNIGKTEVNMTDSGDNIIIVPRYKRRDIAEQENNSQQNTSDKLNKQNRK